MGESSLFEAAEDIEPSKKKGGPKNRINDLNYSDWMKYQKSFFRWQGVQDFVDKSILFFSKEKNDEGASRVLVIGFPEWESTDLLGARDLSHLQDSWQPSGLYDHIVVDFRSYSALSSNGRNQIEEVLDVGKLVVTSLKESAYAQTLFGLCVGSDYPVAWEFAQAIEAHSRLRDERVALHDDGAVSYAPIFQRDEESQIDLGHEFEAGIAKCEAQIPGWTIPKPPPRRKNEKLHPAKYPETLVEQFLDIFSDEGDLVFDPMSGTGSTQVAALQRKRRAIGFELSDEFAELANARLSGIFSDGLFGNSIEEGSKSILIRDATDALSYEDVEQFDYVCTSPPYWSMLRNPGSENQRARRLSNLQTYYSDSDRDLGNIEDYDLFVDVLVEMYALIASHIKRGGFLTVVVKNVKRNHTIFPLAWDIANRLTASGSDLAYVGNTLWCQDDVGLKPFAIGTHWVSNTLHQYCLHFMRV